MIYSVITPEMKIITILAYNNYFIHLCFDETIDIDNKVYILNNIKVYDNKNIDVSYKFKNLTPDTLNTIISIKNVIDELVKN